MRFLLDTNVISELRKGASADPGVTTWIRQPSAVDLALSAVTVMELEIGVARMERRDETQGRQLRRWFEQRVLEGFRDRILPIDLAVARRAVRIHVPDPTPERDTLIAATALTRDLIVVTRNVSDFERIEVPVVDPWAARPESH